MQTRDCEGLTSARAVWDFMTADSRRFLDRVRLMLLAMRRFREQDIKPDFVVLLHAGATKFAARDLTGTKFAADDVKDFPEIHSALADFTSQGGRVEVCGIAMDRSLIGRAALMPYAEIEENVFLNSIALQNRGYAYVLVS